jgi:hypothetical protein
MKSYHILDCPQQQKIADSLYGYFKGITANNPPSQFWTFLTRKQIVEYLSTPNLELLNWFHSMDLRVRDISFTVTNETIKTSPHVDEPPVVAKINFPVLNTQDTYNVWFDNSGNEIDRVECTKPIVLRSNIMHTVEIGHKAILPRIQFSFCFYDDPLHLLK